MATIGFSGGTQLESYLKGISDRINEAQSVAIGFPGGSTYPDGTPVAAVAAFNEYGTSKSPPRPFFRRMIADKSPNWGASIAKLAVKFDYRAGDILDAMGQGIQGQLKDSIQQFTAPALADSTIKAKGFSKPLIDTGHMLNSVEYVVTE